MQLKITTFNCENLFGRYRMLDMPWNKRPSGYERRIQVYDVVALEPGRTGRIKPKEISAKFFCLIWSKNLLPLFFLFLKARSCIILVFWSFCILIFHSNPGMLAFSWVSKVWGLKKGVEIFLVPARERSIFITGGRLALVMHFLLVKGT